MATGLDLLTDLKDRIDLVNEPITDTVLLRYLNHGISAMWPKVYQTAIDTSVVLVTNGYEYAVPAAVGDHALITRIDVESDAASNRYMPFEDVELIPTQTGKILTMGYTPSYVGSRIRFVSAKRVSPIDATADVYTGPPGTEEIPVWYALGLVLSRGVEPRTDYKRYSTTVAANGVDLEEMIITAQYAFAQFELLLERASMPVPSRVG